MTLARRLLIASCLLVSSMVACPAAAIGGQLTLTWVDASSDEVGFSVERSVGATETFVALATTGPDVTTYLDTEVTEATTYCYRVRAFNAQGFSEYSDPACGTSAPTSLTLTLSVNQQAYASGDRFRADVAVVSDGPRVMVDIYWGSVLPPAAGPALGCPEGDAVAYLVDAGAELEGVVVSCRSGEPPTAVPLYTGVAVPGELSLLTGTDILGFNWPTTTPGDYTFFMSITHSGTLEVIALGMVTVSYAP